MMKATDVMIEAVDDLPRDNLQNMAGAIYGKAKYAADQVGSALYKAEHAQETADSISGQAQWSANAVGFLHYHLKAVGEVVGYDVPEIPDGTEAAA